MLMKKIGRVALAAGALCAASLASATTVTLDFEGLQNRESVLGFYGGGAGSLGSTGVNYGITFGDNALAAIDSDVVGPAGGSIGNEPSPSTVLTFVRASAVLNISQGFTDYFSFYYSTVAATGTIRVYDGENATGNVIGVIDVLSLGATCSGDPTGQFCNWALGNVFFDGTARSIDFGGTADQIVFDNVTFGNLSVPTGGGTTPEPMTLALVGSALLALTVSRRRA